MKPLSLKIKYALVLAIGGMLASGPLMAEKPSWAGGGNGGKSVRKDQRDEHKNTRADQRDERGGAQQGERRDNDAKSRRDGPAAAQRGHFEERHREVVREYYTDHYRSGRCPPGLAKKRNGCMPPGQAKKWHVGQPLAREVIYYDVPQPLVVQIGVPPSGYRYVRVASDILLIAIGTGMVVDAIQDLGR
ncbi:MAG: RcnB family protein [Burkholderiales bacterium]|nr:RcnB family protein [Burkholderiales bacterium]